MEHSLQERIGQGNCFSASDWLADTDLGFWLTKNYSIFFAAPGEQRRFEYAVGLVMCVYNFYHSRITENAIYENRYTTTCDNFLEDW